MGLGHLFGAGRSGGAVDGSCSTPTMVKYENPKGPRVQEWLEKQRVSRVLRKEGKGNTGTWAKRVLRWAGPRMERTWPCPYRRLSQG